MTDLSPAAQAVIHASAVEACLAEWGPVNDPPCHPDDEGWNGCHLCVKRDLIAAAFRAAADQLRNAYANEECIDSADDFLDGIATELAHPVPVPEIIPKPQFPQPRIIREDFLP